MYLHHTEGHEYLSPSDISSALLLDVELPASSYWLWWSLVESDISLIESIIPWFSFSLSESDESPDMLEFSSSSIARTLASSFSSTVILLLLSASDFEELAFIFSCNNYKRIYN